MPFLIVATSEDAIGKAYNLGAPDPISLKETANLCAIKLKELLTK